MERKITDLLDCIQDDTVQLKIKDVASIEQIKEATMKKISKNEPAYKRTKKVSTILIASICAVVMLTGTAFAVVGFTVYENPAAMLRAFFGENGVTEKEGGMTDYHDEEKGSTYEVPQFGWERVPVDETLADELVANYISAQSAEISWDDYTLSVEANLYDSVTGAGILYYTLENPNGITGLEISPNGQLGFNPEKASFNIYTSWPSECYIDEAMSTDTEVYICAYYVKTDNRGEELQIKVWSYEKAEDIAAADVSLSDGGSMSTLSLSDGKVLVSPIGICIYDGALGFDIASYIHKIVLRYNDGSEYVLTDNETFLSNSMYALGQYGQSDGSSESAEAQQGDSALPTPMPVDDSMTAGYHTTYVFNRIVDINSLSEIVLDDMVIKVN